MLRSVLLALVLGIVNAWAPLAPRVLRAGPLFHGPGGHPGGHPGGPPAGAAVDNSFVNGELRPYAMNLHTRAQAPREGKAEAKPSEKVPVSLLPYQQNVIPLIISCTCRSRCRSGTPAWSPTCSSWWTLGLSTRPLRMLSSPTPSLPPFGKQVSCYFDMFILPPARIKAYLRVFVCENSTLSTEYAPKFSEMTPLKSPPIYI